MAKVQVSHGLELDLVNRLERKATAEGWKSRSALIQHLLENSIDSDCSSCSRLSDLIQYESDLLPLGQELPITESDAARIRQALSDERDKRRIEQEQLRLRNERAKQVRSRKKLILEAISQNRDSDDDFADIDLVITTLGNAGMAADEANQLIDEMVMQGFLIRFPVNRIYIV